MIDLFQFLNSLHSLHGIIGDVEGQDRWSHLLASGCQTAFEFQGAWEKLAGEAANSWQYLEKLPEGVLAATAAEAGGASLNGSTRTKAVQQLEGLRHQVLTRALSRHQDRMARPVFVYLNIADDKVEGRWLLAAPTKGSVMSSAVFQEALISHLYLPSPAVVEGGYVGRQVGTKGEVCDPFGDVVMNCGEIVGDSWTHQHDGIKQHIVAEAQLSDVKADCEVYDLFSDLIPAVLEQEGGELQWGRARQGKVPDFKFLLQTPDGPQSSLAELKCVHAGKTWY